MEAGGGCLLRDGVCMSLEQLTKAVGRARAALTILELLGKVLAELRVEERLVCLANCTREDMRSNGVRLFDGDARMVFVKSEFVTDPFRPTVQTEMITH